MSLEQRYEYEIPENIKKNKDREGQVLGLLRDVRANVCLLRPDISSHGLDVILKAVEEGEWILQKKDNAVLKKKGEEAELNYNIDLYQAKYLIGQYRRDSEGGCRPCIHIRSYMPCQDEHVTYCNLYEKEGVVSEGSSPRIAEFYKRGCDDRDPVLKRKLEEILQGQN